MAINKELKETYKNELRKAWDSEHMVDYCLKKTAYIIEHNGLLYDIDKPDIQKDFCFGYGYCGMSTEEERKEAREMSNYARKNEEYFINENLKGINTTIDTFKEIIKDIKNNNSTNYSLVTLNRYYSQTANCKLRSIHINDIYNPYFDGEPCKDLELMEKILSAYEQVKEDFTKRLNAYLKRYGLSKINTWTYLVD